MAEVLARERHRALVANPRMLSLREAVVLADIWEKEKCVRKDVDAGVFAGADVICYLDRSHRFGWDSVVVFAAIYGNTVMIESKTLRTVAATKIYSTCRTAGVVAGFCPHESVYIDKYLTVPVGQVCEDVKPRVDLYKDGLAKVEEKDSVMGGAAVFKNSRLPVHHVAKLVEDGETIENIIEDYPYLSSEDIEFACLYNRARPIVGRPRSSGDSHEAPDAG